MKAYQVQKFKCEICGHSYDTADDALSCEARPVLQSKGAKVGDRVRVLTGEGVGKEATVDSVLVFDKYWGHHAWDRYWHTEGVTAKMDDWGNRLLTFDAYELIGGAR